MDRKALESRLIVLEQSRDAAVADANFMDGQLCELHFWLHQMDKADERTELTPVSHITSKPASDNKA